MTVRVAALAAVAFLVSCSSDPSPSTADLSTAGTRPPPTSAPAPASTVPAPTSTTVATPPASTPTSGTPIDPVVTELCAQPADAIVVQLLEDLQSGGRPQACVAPELWPQLDRIGADWFTFEVDRQPPQFGDSGGALGWTVPVAIDRTGSVGSISRAVQRWTLTDLDGALLVTAIEPVDTTEVTADGIAIVADYLDRLGGERYAAAAELLGGGGLSLGDRPDLAALPLVPSSVAELGEGLRRWCASGGECEPATRLTAVPDIRGVSATVTATWGTGELPATGTFVASRWEGDAVVTGLPPLTGDAALGVIAAATGASTVVATLPDGRVVAFDEGVVTEIPVPADTTPWSDGTFVSWTVWLPDGPRSSAAGLDGSIVCEVEGGVQRVRLRSDGGYVATVERPTEAVADFPEYPVPRYAVDCATGDETAIEPRTWHREGGFRGIFERAGRTFTTDGDAEGNGDVYNEEGVSLNGDDYAGVHSFSPDAGLVVYGDYGVSVSPHVTDTIRLRETVGGELLWSAELDRTFGGLFVTDSRVVVASPPEQSQYEPWFTTEYLELRDIVSGEQLVRIPTAIDLIHLS